MNNDKKKHVCLKCGKSVDENVQYCDNCLKDMRLEAEIAEYEKQIEM